MRSESGALEALAAEVTGSYVITSVALATLVASAPCASAWETWAHRQVHFREVLSVCPSRWSGLKTCFLPSQTFSSYLSQWPWNILTLCSSSCCCHLRQTVVVANFHTQEVHKQQSAPRIAILIQTVIVSLRVYNCHLAWEWVHRQMLEWFVCRCFTLSGNQLYSQRILNNAIGHSELLCSISGTQMISELCYLLYIFYTFPQNWAFVHDCLPIIFEW